MTTVTVAAAAVSLAACACDLRSRRIPNVLTIGAAAAGVGFHLVTGGLTGAMWAAAGLAMGSALFLPAFVLGGLGAGDVKLMAALGAWLGPADTGWTALYAALAGGAMAVVVALSRGYLRTALKNVWVLLGFWRFAGVRPLDGMTLQTSKGPRLPYALAITAGLFATLWFH